MTWTSRTRLYNRTMGLNKGSGVPKKPWPRRGRFSPLLLFKAGTVPPPNRLKALLLSGSCTLIQEGAIWSGDK